MSQTLKGQCALVTGAGSGIGSAIARNLDDAGCRVALCGRRMRPLEELAESLSNEPLCIECDVRDAENIRPAVSAAVQEFGRLDILINNAGIFTPSPFAEVTLEALDATLETNLRGAFLMAQAAWPHLTGSRGQLVNISSIAGTQPFKESSAYCASKFGLNGLSEVLALEGKEAGIRVHCICPGSVDTPIWQTREASDITERMMSAEEIARLVRWLLESPRNLEFGHVVVTNFTSPWE